MDLKKKSLVELRGIAKKLGVPVAGKTVPDLVRAIEKAEKAKKGKGTPADPKSGKKPTRGAKKATDEDEEEDEEEEGADEDEEEEDSSDEDESEDEDEEADEDEEDEDEDEAPKKKGKSADNSKKDLADRVAVVEAALREMESRVKLLEKGKGSGKKATDDEDEEEDDDEEEEIDLSPADLAAMSKKELLAAIDKIEGDKALMKAAKGKKISRDGDAATIRKAITAFMTKYAPSDDEEEDSSDDDEEDEDDEEESERPDWLREGAAVEVDCGDENESDWQPGVIAEGGINDDEKTVDVTFDDGDEAEGVSWDNVRQKNKKPKKR